VTDPLRATILAFGGGYELGAICGSVAAAWQLKLDLDVVFHDRGYRGEGDHLADVYRSGAAPGVPLLEWAGLTWAPGRPTNPPTVPDRDADDGAYRPSRTGACFSPNALEPSIVFSFKRKDRSRGPFVHQLRSQVVVEAAVVSHRRRRCTGFRGHDRTDRLCRRSLPFPCSGWRAPAGRSRVSSQR